MLCQLIHLNEHGNWRGPAQEDSLFGRQIWKLAEQSPKHFWDQPLDHLLVTVSAAISGVNYDTFPFSNRLFYPHSIIESSREYLGGDVR